MKRLSKKIVQKFQLQVYEYYQKYGRRFPWRDTHNPYRILVSEVMLQQTQAERVVPFFRRFVKTFPSVTALARAKTADVVRAWQGLGYNRRALNLQRAAQVIVRVHKGQMPKDSESLDALPGVGKYTAAAILAFAFNRPSVFVETNIRTVFLYYFLRKRKNVSDLKILDLVGQTVDLKNPREWYQALMDYGAMLKRTVGNENKRSKQYSKQSPFKGSRREIRGGLLKLASQGTVTQNGFSVFSKKVGLPVGDVRDIAGALVSEGFLRKVGKSYSLR